MFIAIAWRPTRCRQAVHQYLGKNLGFLHLQEPIFPIFKFSYLDALESHEFSIPHIYTQPITSYNSIYIIIEPYFQEFIFIPKP